jgi:hypothetical protein
MGENNILPDKPRLPANHIPKEGEIRTTTELGISTTWLGYWIWRICPDCNKGKWIRCNNNKPVSTRCFKCAIKHKTLLHNSRYPTPHQIEQYKPQIGDIRYAKEIGKSGSGYWEWCQCIKCNRIDWVRTKKGQHLQSYKCLNCARKPDYMTQEQLSHYTPQEGDIRYQKEIGMGLKWKAIWAICPDCKKGRWSRLVRGKPETKICIDCQILKSTEQCKARRKTPNMTQTEINSYTPKLGDIVHANEIGRVGNARYIYTKCTKCTTEFWIILRNGKPRINTCYNCSKHKKYGKKDSVYKLFEECTSCHNIYPATTEYFRTAEGVYSGIRTTCLKCYATKNNKRNRQRRKDSPLLRLNDNMGTYLYMSLIHYKKIQRWQDLVGYTIDDLKSHLESQFHDGMSWDNYGKKNKGWHVDHIVAKCHFNYSTPHDYDFKRCWALSNLRPMWGIDNIKKGHRLENPFQPALKLAVWEKRGSYAV